MGHMSRRDRTSPWPRYIVRTLDRVLDHHRYASLPRARLEARRWSAQLSGGVFVTDEEDRVAHMFKRGREIEFTRPKFTLPALGPSRDPAESRIIRRPLKRPGFFVAIQKTSENPIGPGLRREHPYRYWAYHESDPELWYASGSAAYPEQAVFFAESDVLETIRRIDPERDPARRGSRAPRFVVMNQYGDLETPRISRREAEDKARRWSKESRGAFQVVDYDTRRVVARYG